MSKDAPYRLGLFAADDIPGSFYRFFFTAVLANGEITVPHSPW